jgi:hypothetical protein
MHASSIVARGFSDSGCVTAHPEVAPKRGYVRMGDQPDNSTQARFEYAVLSFHALSSGKKPCAVTAVLGLVHFL